MKNNRKKQTSSYLLIFLGIVAALLILIILYLTFFRKDSQSSINLAKNDSATDQTENLTDGETFGFTSGDETSDNADQSGFVSDDGSSDSESSTDDSSVQGPSQRESAGPVQSSPTPEEVTVPYQTPAANGFFPVIRFRLRSDNRWHFPGKKRFYHGCYYPRTF